MVVLVSNSGFSMKKLCKKARELHRTCEVLVKVIEIQKHQIKF